MNNNHTHAKQDSQPIKISDAGSVEYWTKELGISKERLAQVTQAVGTYPAAVRRYARLNPEDRIKQR